MSIRQYAFPTIPDALPPVDAKLCIAKDRPIDANFDIKIYKASTDLFNLDVGDWGNLDIFRDSMNTGSMATEVFYEFDAGSPGPGNHTYIAVSSLDEDQVKPVGANANRILGIGWHMKQYTKS